MHWVNNVLNKVMQISCCCWHLFLHRERLLSLYLDVHVIKLCTNLFLNKKSMMLGHFLPVKGPSMPVTSSSPESSREGPKLSIYFFHYYGPSPRSIRQSLPRTALALNLRREWPQKLIFLLVALPSPEKEQTLLGTDSAPRLGKEGPHFFQN